MDAEYTPDTFDCSLDSLIKKGVDSIHNDRAYSKSGSASIDSNLIDNMSQNEEGEIVPIKTQLLSNVHYNLSDEPTDWCEHVHSIATGLYVSNQSFQPVLKIICNSKYCTDVEVILSEQDWDAISNIYVEQQFRNFFRTAREYHIQDKSSVIAVNDNLAIYFNVQKSEKFIEILTHKKLVTLSECEFGKLYDLTPLINHQFSCLYHLRFESFYRNSICTIAGIIKTSGYLKGEGTGGSVSQRESELRNTILSCVNIISLCTTAEFASYILAGTYTCNYLCLLEIVKFYPDKFVYDVQSRLTPHYDETYV